MIFRAVLIGLGLGMGSSWVQAQGKAEKVVPTHANVSYGPHERNVMDLWLAKSEKATPVIVFIHGGGFRNGSKDGYGKSYLIKEALERGVSCAAINYRFLYDAPVQDILKDCARAVQFLRFKSKEWNLDKSRVGAIGGSAGAGTSLWLATRDDLANPMAEDPVLRESSRVQCAVLTSTQATYDVTKWESFLGPAETTFWQELELSMFYRVIGRTGLASEAGKAILKECDMLGWISKDDAPIFMDSKQDVPKPTNRGEWLHCTTHARTVKKALQAVGVEAIVLQDQPADAPRDAGSWLLGKLLHESR
jgi:acetyl esterase